MKTSWMVSLHLAPGERAWAPAVLVMTHIEMAILHGFRLRDRVFNRMA